MAAHLKIPACAGMTVVSFISPYCVLEMNRFRWVYGQDVRRAALSWERMAACPPKSVHFQVAEGHTMGAALSLVTSFGQAKEVTCALTRK